MRTITIAAAKGGAGKSTIASALAVRAARDGRVAMFDLNSDQGNLTQWWITRGEPENPGLLSEIVNIPQDVMALAREGFDHLLIDTPPLNLDIIEQSIAVSDAVIIPIRTSLFDVSSIETVTALCRKHRRPYAFVLSAVDHRFKQLTAQTIAALVNDGPMVASRISYRLQYISALNDGKTGPEIDKELAGEIDSLWAEVVRLAGTNPVAPAPRKGGRIYSRCATNRDT